jgi:hypothetical protein
MEEAIEALEDYIDKLRKQKIYYHNKGWIHLKSEVNVAICYTQSSIEWLKAYKKKS